MCIRDRVVDCNETLIELKHAEGERVGQGDTIASVYRSPSACLSSMSVSLQSTTCSSRTT